MYSRKARRSMEEPIGINFDRHGPVGNIPVKSAHSPQGRQNNTCASEKIGYVSHFSSMELK